MADLILPWDKKTDSVQQPSLNAGGENKNLILPWETKQEESVSVGGIVKAIPATALRLGVGMASWIPEGLVNAADLAVSGVQGKVPTFEAGKKVAETIQNVLPAETSNVAAVEAPFMYPFKKLAEWQTKAGEATYEKTGSPTLAAAAETAVGALPFAIPYGIGKGAQALKIRLAKLKEATDVMNPGETPAVPVTPLAGPRPNPVEESLRSDPSAVEIDKQMNDPSLTEMKMAVETPVASIVPTPEIPPEVTATSLPESVAEITPVGKVETATPEIAPPAANLEADYTKQATNLGIIFNGMQERLNKPSMPLFTDKETGSTFTPAEGETVQQALERKREEFKQTEIVQPAATSGGKPIVSRASLNDSMIQLSFDSSGKVPTVTELKEAFPGAEVVKTAPGLIGTTTGTTHFRIDVFDEAGRLSPNKAKELYNEALGGLPKRFNRPTELERAIPFEERFKTVVDTANDRLSGINRQPKQSPSPLPAGAKVAEVSPALPEAVLTVAKNTNTNPADIIIITPEQRKEYFNRYGVPNLIDTGEGIGAAINGKGGSLFINDDTGKPVAYLPAMAKMTTDEWNSRTRTLSEEANRLETRWRDWSVSHPSNVKGRTAEAKQIEFNNELYRRKKAYEQAKTEAEKYGYGKQEKIAEVSPVEAGTPAIQKGTQLRDSKTGITYTVNAIVKPKGGKTAWVGAEDRHKNGIKIDPNDIGTRYIQKDADTFTPTPRNSAELKAKIAEGKVEEPKPGPGAKTAGATGETPANPLTDLTSTLSALPKRSKTEFSQPVDYSGVISSGIKRTLSTFESVKSEAMAVWDRFVKEPVVTTYDKIMGEYDLGREEAGLAGMKWGKQIMVIVPKHLQDAVTNYIEAGGDAVTLLDRASKSTDPKLSKGYTDAANLPPDIKIFAENVRSYFDSWLDKLQDAGVLGDQFIENYVNHIWDVNSKIGKQIRAEIDAGVFKTNPSLTRKRIIESYFEGEKLGLSSKNKGIGYLVAAYSKDASESLNARKAVASMFAGKAEDGKPIVIPDNLTARRVDSKEYRIVDPNGAKNQNGESRALRVFDTEDEAKDYLKSKSTDPEDGPTDKSNLQIVGKDRSAIFLGKKGYTAETAADGRAYRPGPNHPALREFTWTTSDAEGNPIFYKGDVLIHPDHYNNLSNALKTSAIRKSDIGRMALASIGFAKQTMLSLSVFHPVQLGIHAIGHTVDIFHLKDIDLTNETQRLAVKSGLSLKFGDGMQEVSEGVYGGGLVDRIPLVGEVSRALGSYTFQDLLPRLKMNMFLDAFERNKERYKKLSIDQIASKTADEANNAFGGLNYRKMGRNPTFQDSLRLIALAPDFLEARLRFAGQAASGALGGVPHLEQTLAILRLSIGMYTAARIANKFLDDDYHWDRPFSIIAKGQEFTLRSVPGDFMHLINDPRSFIYHRINPTLTRTAIEGLTGRDMFGKERDLAAQFKDLVVTHMPIPFQGPFRKGDQTLWESAVSSMGLSTYKFKTAADRELSYILSLTIPRRQQDAEEAAMSNAKSKMKDAIRNNKDISPEIMKEINKLSPEQAKRIMLDATRYARFQDGFEHLNMRDALKVYNKAKGTLGIGADEKETQMATQMIVKKYGLAMKHSPHQILGLTDGEKADLQGILEKFQ